MNDDLLEPRFSRAASLRLAAVGAAGLVLGVRPARAVRSSLSDAESVEAAARAFLQSLAPAERARASFAFGSAERTRWHWTVPSSVPRNGLPLGAMSAEQRRLALALLRASSSTAGYRKALTSWRSRVCSDASTRASPTRSIQICSTSRCSARPAREPGAGGFEGHHLSQALHRRWQHARGRAVLPRRLADSCDQRVSVGREGLPDDAARRGRRPGDRALCSTARYGSGSCSRRSR